jgi:restriction system protein
MARNDSLPKYHELMNPLIRALQDLGGSGSIEEIAAKVTETLDLPDAVLNLPHDPEKSSQTEIEYRLAWARTYLKKYGILDNSSRGIWVIRPEKRDIKSVDPRDVVRTVREQDRQEREDRRGAAEQDDDTPEVEAEVDWRGRLHQVLTKDVQPDAFERLVKRLLRESGFVQVEVTGRSHDGGIDGKGIVKIGGLLTFHVLFQCKRYQGTVSASAIRDFRGALIGRADKGIMVTTGTFTREAIREATRDGAPPIDLMDGDELADKLKELELGIRTEMVETVHVDLDWFRAI